GYYGIGTYCTKTCSSGCNGKPCNNNGTCLCKPDFTGNACDSCVDCKYGANCSMQCSRGCEGNNYSSTDGSCTCSNYYSGEQCENCIAGRYGEDCSKECSLGCLENTCSAVDGKCYCKNFYTGNNCDVCVDGRFGENNCNQKCSSDCNSVTCYPNGTCICKPDVTGDACRSCVVGKYGANCSMDCSRGCEGKNCSSSDGTCNCRRNYNGDQCENCTAGRYGDDCSKLCSLGCLDDTCSSNEGKNKLCCKKPRDEQLSEETPEPVVYATVQNRRNNLYEDILKATDDSNIVQENVEQEAGHRVNIRTQHVELVMTDETTEDDGLEVDEDDQEARAIAVKFEEKGGTYCNNVDTINKQKVAVNSLTKYVIEKTDTDIEEEFEKFPYGLTKPYAVSQKHEHIQRNRYKGIYPYDDTRVKLRNSQTDYINASHIDGYNKRHAYIAALGPMSKQLGDFSPFWQMIWQEKVEKIVMLTNLVEKGKDKCEQYWPHPGNSKHYGMYYVSCLNEDEYADYIRREFTISKGRETRELHHLHFTFWPDKGVPEEVTGIVEFRQRVQNIPSEFDGPVLVHCSAGVGRTGTYIALDILTK
ncbi:PTPRT-like protein, partial [Mya arenaria]